MFKKLVGGIVSVAIYVVSVVIFAGSAILQKISAGMRCLFYRTYEYTVVCSKCNQALISWRTRPIWRRAPQYKFIPSPCVFPSIESAFGCRGTLELQRCATLSYKKRLPRTPSVLAVLRSANELRKEIYAEILA